MCYQWTAFSARVHVETTSSVNNTGFGINPGPLSLTSCMMLGKLYLLSVSSSVKWD